MLCFETGPIKASLTVKERIAKAGEAVTVTAVVENDSKCSIEEVELVLQVNFSFLDNLLSTSLGHLAPRQ